MGGRLSAGSSLLPRRGASHTAPGEWTPSQGNHKTRCGWDSNPRDGCPPGGFQNRCLRPLSHRTGETQAYRGPCRASHAQNGWPASGRPHLKSGRWEGKPLNRQRTSPNTSSKQAFRSPLNREGIPTRPHQEHRDSDSRAPSPIRWNARTLRSRGRTPREHGCQQLSARNSGTEHPFPHILQCPSRSSEGRASGGGKPYLCRPDAGNTPERVRLLHRRVFFEKCRG